LASYHRQAPSADCQAQLLVLDFGAADFLATSGVGATIGSGWAGAGFAGAWGAAGAFVFLFGICFIGWLLFCLATPRLIHLE
jgi:hypothetical protein